MGCEVDSRPHDRRPNSRAGAHHQAAYGRARRPAPGPRAPVGQGPPRRPGPFRRPGHRVPGPPGTGGRGPGRRVPARRCSASAIPCTITIWFATAAAGLSRSTPAGSSCGRPGWRTATDSPSPVTRPTFSGCAPPARAAPETTTPAPELARASRVRVGQADSALELALARELARRRLAPALPERLAEALELEVPVVLGRDVQLLGRAVGVTDGQLVRLALGNLGPVDVRDVHGDRLGAQADSFQCLSAHSVTPTDADFSKITTGITGSQQPVAKYLPKQAGKWAIGVCLSAWVRTRMTRSRSKRASGRPPERRL